MEKGPEVPREPSFLSIWVCHSQSSLDTAVLLLGVLSLGWWQIPDARTRC